MYNLPFTGNLTRDPELAPNNSGTPRVNFSLGVNEGERGSDNEKKHFFPFTAFGDVAENMVKSLKSGDRVTVIARANTYKKDVQLNGEDKSLTLVGFTATDVLPSLRFATATVHRIPKKGGASSSTDSFQDDSAAPAPKAAAKTAPAKPAAAAAGDDDF